MKPLLSSLLLISHFWASFNFTCARGSHVLLACKLPCHYPKENIILSNSSKYVHWQFASFCLGLIVPHYCICKSPKIFSNNENSLKHCMYYYGLCIKAISSSLWQFTSEIAVFLLKARQSETGVSWPQKHRISLLQTKRSETWKATDNHRITQHWKILQSSQRNLNKSPFSHYMLSQQTVIILLILIRKMIFYYDLALSRVKDNRDRWAFANICPPCALISALIKTVSPKATRQINIFDGKCWNY